MTKAKKVVGREVEVVWLCRKCIKTGTLTFGNHTSVGQRLQEAEKQHASQSPECVLDWNNIIVQSAAVI